QFTLREKDSPHIQLGDHLLINFLEMPKLKLHKNLNSLEQWLLYFKKEGKENKIVEDIIIKDDLIDKVHQDYKKFMEDEKLRIQALSREMGYRDHLSRMNFAEKKGLENGLEKGLKKGLEKGLKQGIKKGMEKGMEKGIEQGVEKAKREDALKMKNHGLEIKLIHEISGLSEETIKDL
nr:hypothetical protein [Spirochaetaceae bacterium]